MATATKQQKRSLALPKLPKRESTGVPRSQLERLWLVSGGLIAFVMLLIGYFFFISPQRSDTASVNDAVATARQQNAVLQARLDALNEQNKDLAKYQAEQAALEQALPSTSDISDFLRTLQSLGNATLTDVTALTVGQPVAITPVAAAQPSSSPGAVATSAPAVNAPVATSSVYGLPITATVTGSANALTKFLDQLQAVQPRAVLISDIELAQSADSATPGAFSLSLTMKAFVAPAAAPASGGASSSAAG
jgi:Tfp pilus assembly protein PilO